MYTYIYIYTYIHMFGGAPLTSLAARMWSRSRLAYGARPALAR